MIYSTGKDLRERYHYYMAQQVMEVPSAEDFSPPSKKVEQIVKMYQFKKMHFNKFKLLTDREVEVLNLLANGHNNPQIAGKLFLSRQTVETHRKKIKQKLGIKSLLDLMRYAFAFDLVEC